MHNYQNSKEPYLVKDINLDGSSTPSNLIAAKDSLFFVADDGSSGKELWQTDDTGTIQLSVSTASTNIGGTPGSGIQNITDADDTVFFTTGAIFNESPRLYKSDGTPDGTVLVQELPSNNQFFYYQPAEAITFNGNLFFTTIDETTGEELWQSDGTPEGTSLFKDINLGTESAIPKDFLQVDDTLYFTANDDIHGRELWKTDGTHRGTVLVQDIQPGSDSSSPFNLTDVGDSVYFFSDSDNGYQLWKSDGMSGTVALKTFAPSNQYYSPFGLTDVNGTAFFIADDGATGYELWKSDGTEAGTVLVKDINPGSDPSVFAYQDSLINADGTLFFTISDGPNAGELWKSDGTEAGTVVVKEGLAIAKDNIAGNESATTPDNLTSVGGKVYFSATDDSNGTELWQSDGTTVGTVLIADINPGSESSNPDDITYVNGMLYFTADGGSNDRELWALDINDRVINPASSNSLTPDIFLQGGSDLIPV